MLRYNQILSGICVLMCGIPKALGCNFCSEKVCRDVSWYMWPFSIFFITGVLLRFVPIGLVWNVTWCRWMQIVHLHRTFTFVNCTTAVSKLLPLEYLPWAYKFWCFQLDFWSVWLSMISHQKLPWLQAQALGLHHWSCGNGSRVLALEVEQLDKVC